MQGQEGRGVAPKEQLLEELERLAKGTKPGPERHVAMSDLILRRLQEWDEEPPSRSSR